MRHISAIHESPKVTNEDLLVFIQQMAETSAAAKEPPPPEPHPLQYFDAWFILAALVTTMAMTSSYQFPIGFEGLVFISLGCLVCALVANLTRDRVFITPQIRHRRSQRIDLRKLQEKHGIRPVDYQ